MEVWTDAHNVEIRAAKRIPFLPAAGDTQQDRRIDIGYTVLPVIDSFAVGSDAAMHCLDRLHLVW